MNKKILLIAVFLIVIFVVFALFIYEGQYLLVSNERDGSVLFYAKVSDGEQFSIAYHHSVNKSFVYEYYTVQNTQIYLTELRYTSFGAGMPTFPEEGQVMRVEGGDIIIDGFARQIPYLCYFIGRTSDHTLHIGGESIPLDTLDTPGQPVLFSIVSYPRFLTWRLPAYGR
jgi:hypothetical protein